MKSCHKKQIEEIVGLVVNYDKESITLLSDDLEYYIPRNDKSIFDINDYYKCKGEVYYDAKKSKNILLPESFKKLKPGSRELKNLCSASAATSVLEKIHMELCDDIHAIVLSHDHCSVLMFNPDRMNQPLFRLPIKSLNGLLVGKWYRLQTARKDDHDFPVSSEIPMLQISGVAELLSAGPPIRTRISNGAVQFYTEVTLGNRCDMGFLHVNSKQFSDIIDSTCLLDHLYEDLTLLQIPIRHAPLKKIGIWCSVRKYPIGSTRWKVVGVNAKYRKKKPNLLTDEASALINADSPTFNKKKEPILDNPMISKEVIDGLICSQTTSNFIVYSPKHRWVAHLDKKRSKENLLGIWIQFQIRTGNGPKMVENFWMARPRIMVMPTHEYTMFRGTIDVPRALESAEDLYLWCHEMCLKVVDSHALLRRCHRGRTINATIGCASELLESECNIDEITWEILHVDDC